MRVSWIAALCTFVGAARAAPGQLSLTAARDPLPPLAEFHVRSYAAADGLEASGVTALAQMRDGFLYAATGKGLFRFDSRKFEPIALPGFGSALIQDLFVDSRQRLWIRSAADDLAFIDSGTVHVLGRLPLSGDAFTSTSDGTVWISGAQGLVRIAVGRPDWFTVFTRAEGLPCDTVAGVFETPRGELIVPTGTGLTRLIHDPRESRGVRFELVASVGRSTVSRNDVRSDANGLWVSYPDTKQAIRYHDGAVTSIGPPGLGLDDFSWRKGDETTLFPGLNSRLRDPEAWARQSLIPFGWHLSRGLMQRDGTRWFDLRRTVRHSELTRITPSGKPELIDLSDRPEWSVVTSLLEDHEGSIWVGTDRGLLQLVKRRVRAVTRRDGLPDEFIFPVLQTRDDAVWVGSWGEGLFRFAHGARAERMSVAQGLQDDRVRSLFESSDGALWVGMRTACARIVAGRVAEQIPIFNEVRGFAETAEHVLWIAGARELVARAPDGHLKRIPIGPTRPLWSIFAERDGSLLLGTQRGLFRMTPESSDSLIPVAADAGLGDAFVTGIFAESDGTVWIGTYDRGLFRLRSTHADHVDARVGMPSSIFSLVDDRRGAIWLGGNDGIWRVQRDSLHIVADDIAQGRPPRLTLRPVRIGETEGAAGSETNRASPGAWRLRDGRLVFNGTRGLSVVDVEAPEPVSASPRTVVLSVVADGERIASIDDRASLPPRTHRVEIAFTTFSFIAPRQHRFRYRLDGFDPDWIEAGAEARTQYTNLRPGRYTFHVQSIAPAGQAWVNSAATEVIEVQAAWWQSRLFQLGLVTAICVAAYGLHRLRLNQEIALHRLRATIASDLHDDLGSSLNSIALMTQLLNADADVGGPTKHSLARIQRATEETATSLRQLVWLVDPKHGDLEYLFLRLRRVANDLLPHVDVRFDIAASIRPRAVSMTVMRNVLLIFKEALNNIGRHASATHVDVSLVEQRGALVMTIRDNGAGFDVGRVEYGNGIQNMRRRTGELGGDLIVESGPRAGTRLVATIKLP